jgi:hypothetical protein
LFALHGGHSRQWRNEHGHESPWLSLREKSVAN